MVIEDLIDFSYRSTFSSRTNLRSSKKKIITEKMIQLSVLNHNLMKKTQAYERLNISDILIVFEGWGRGNWVGIAFWIT